MSFSRLVSPDTHAALLVVVGSALGLVPFALGLPLAAVAIGVVAGLLAIGLGLAGTAPEGRRTITLAVHAACDLGLAVGLVLAAAAFSVIGEEGAALFFLVVGLVQLSLSAVTRYSAGPATPPLLQ